MMSTQTLVVTAGHQPHKIVPWQDAVVMMFNGKVRVLREYEEIIGRIGLDNIVEFEALVDALPFRDDGGSDITIKVPAVVALAKEVPQKKRRIQFSRLNVFTRDKFRCQYCGEKKKMVELTYEHVIPRDQGGKTMWENIVAACKKCNGRKANRTPEQAGMKLLRKPAKPTYLQIIPMHILQFGTDRMKRIHPLWEDFYGFPGSDEIMEEGEN